MSSHVRAEDSADSAASARGRGGPGSRARVALSTASVYPETCADAFAIAARLGYDGVELMVWTDAISQDAAALARLSLHYDVPVLAVHAPTLLVTQRVWGREPWAKLERTCRTAVSLGAGVVVVHPPFRWQREYAEAFAEGIADLERRFQVGVAVENMYPWRAGARSVQAYLPGWDPRPFGYDYVTLDLSHTATAGVDAVEMARDLGPRLAHVHLGDSLGSAKDEHLVPGRGTVPCAEVLGLLAERSFDGTVVVEINTRRCRSRAEREEDLAESLAFARQHLAVGTPDVDPLTGPVPVTVGTPDVDPLTGQVRLPGPDAPSGPPTDPHPDPGPVVVLDSGLVAAQDAVAGAGHLRSGSSRAEALSASPARSFRSIWDGDRS